MCCAYARTVLDFIGIKYSILYAISVGGVVPSVNFACLCGKAVHLERYGLVRQECKAMGFA